MFSEFEVHIKLNTGFSGHVSLCSERLPSGLPRNRCSTAGLCKKG